ncbi:hypothetical protein ACFE04_009544 [Oxalis oulophora]
MALRDHNTLPVSERKTENFCKQSFTKPCDESTSENGEECQQKKSTSLDPAHVSCSETETTTKTNGGDIACAEVEYTESENLSDVEDLDSTIKTLQSGLESKDWVLVCESLNNVRRLSIFHKEAMLDILGDVIALIVKSLKNPRSAVCKTAIMTSADIFQAYSDGVIDFLDPLLVQLLLKSSQDKRFVCEAAERTLVAMTTWISPSLLMPKLQPNLKHRNPRIRAKASMCFCRCVPRLGVEGIKAYGIDKLIQVAASQLSDKLPESREAARTLVLELQIAYEKSPQLTENVIFEVPEVSSWENFIQLKLSPLSAQAVLRVTNINGQGIALGS